MKKRCITLAVTLAMAGTLCLPFTALAIEGEDVLSGSVQTGLSGGEVSAADNTEAGDSEKDIITNDESGIPDTSLYQAILDTGDSDGDGILTRKEAEGITVLNAPPARIESLEGISNLKNLVELSLARNKLKSLKGIEGLTKLEVLDASYNELGNLDYIKNLTSLKELSLYWNELEYVKGIENLIRLKHLDVGHNQLKNLKGIETVTSLETLWVMNNQIQSLDEIKYLINLQELSVFYNPLGTLDGIENLTKLVSLDAFDCKLTSIQGIDKLIQLEKLQVEENQLTSLSGVEKLRNLQYLFASNNLLKTLPNLKGLNNLEILALEWNYLTEKELLSKLPAHIADDEHWIYVTLQSQYASEEEENKTDSQPESSDANSNAIGSSASDIPKAGNPKTGESAGTIFFIVLAFASALTVVHNKSRKKQ